MKTEETINIMWYNLQVAMERVNRQTQELETAILNRNLEKTGDKIKELLRETIEIYTRIGVIAALEELL